MRARKLKLFARALASNAVNFVSKDLHAALRKASGRGEELTSPAAIAAYFRGCFDDYLEQLGIERGRAGAFLRDKELLEYGPGDIPGVAMLMVAHGARRVTCVDRFPLMRLSDANRAVTAELAAGLGATERERLLACFSGDGADGALRPERISYVVSEHGLSGLRDQVDLVYSRSVLEHVNRLDLTLVDMATAMKPGALMIHKVDLRSHGFEWGHPLDFLRVSDSLWRMMSSHNGSMSNRLRVSDFRREIAATPFDDARLTPTAEISPTAAESIRAELAPRFRARSIDDLTTLGFWLRARRGGRDCVLAHAAARPSCDPG